MKKFFAVLLLVICSSAAALAASVFNAGMFVLTGFGFAATIIVALVPFCAIGYGNSFWARVFAEKFSVKMPAFALISHIPPVICAAVYLGIYIKLDAHSMDFLAKTVALVFAVSITATAVLYPVSSLIWYINTKNIGKVLTNESKN